MGQVSDTSNITDLIVHDLCHEAIPRMFDSCMKIREVVALSGHKTASQLLRYMQVGFHELGILLMKTLQNVKGLKS